MNLLTCSRAACVVAHPDDEVLWGGGLILKHPSWNWHVVSICRGTDSDRAPRFFDAMHHLNAQGEIADLDDGPEQKPLDADNLESTICQRLGDDHWDLLITHGPRGEYTRHRRHEEVCEAVVRLWETKRITCRELWMFAYNDQNPSGLPQAQKGASIQTELGAVTWKRKFRLITKTYGFSPDSWEARVTPRQEAFFSFKTPAKARAYVKDHAPDKPNATK